MASPKVGGVDDVASVDPSWWAPAIYDEFGSLRDYQGPTAMSRHLFAVCADAANADEVDELKACVLDVLAKASSPMLVPDNWAEPYEPFLRFTDGRSVKPDDLNQDEFALLARVAPLIEHPALRARAADIAWTYGDRRNHELLALAIDAYRSVALDSRAWLHGGRDGWRRALELSLRRGKAGRPALREMAAQLADFLLAADLSAGFRVIEVSRLLAVTRAVDEETARRLADHLVSLAAQRAGNHRLRHALELQARFWLSRIGESDLVHECSVRIALIHVDEADERMTREGGAMAAGVFIEDAISTLRVLPRQFRSAHGLDRELERLRDRLADLRRATLEQMVTFESDPIDLTDSKAAARELVSGQDRLTGLVTLARILPWIDAAQEITNQREQLRGSLAGFLGSSTFSADARKVATRAAFGASEPDENAVLTEVIRTFSTRVSLLVSACIYPAFEVLTFEHRFDLDFLTDICLESPAVPHGHAGLWARGLRHGLSGDFPSAVSMLVPQIEHLVRGQLNAHGVYTLLVGENGVETEKGLNALLEMSEALQVFGPDLTLELRALLCEQVGSNLRNNLAHGLLNDAQAASAAAVYAWWTCLRLVILPYCALSAAGESDPAERTLDGQEVDANAGAAVVG